MNEIRIIIVDDERRTLEGLSTLIPWDEYGISLCGTAENGQKALDIILREHPDIVLTDIKNARHGRHRADQED